MTCFHTFYKTYYYCSNQLFDVLPPDCINITKSTTFSTQTIVVFAHGLKKNVFPENYKFTALKIVFRESASKLAHTRHWCKHGGIEVM